MLVKTNPALIFDENSLKSQTLNIFPASSWVQSVISFLLLYLFFLKGHSTKASRWTKYLVQVVIPIWIHKCKYQKYINFMHASFLLIGGPVVRHLNWWNCFPLCFDMPWSFHVGTGEILRFLLFGYQLKNLTINSIMNVSMAVGYASISRPRYHLFENGLSLNRHQAITRTIAD